MGLYISTTGTNVEISELGITIAHPTVERSLDQQFDADEIRGAESLTTAIRNGTLVWKRVSGGVVETPTEYDPDFLDAERENTGDGLLDDDRVVLFKDLVANGPLSGTFPVEFVYGGNSNAGRVLKYVNDSDSDDQPYLVVGGGSLKAVSFGSVSLSTGSMGIYAIRVGVPVLLYTISFSAQNQVINKPLSVPIIDNDKIYVEQTSGSSIKPYVVIYIQTS